MPYVSLCVICPAIDGPRLTCVPSCAVTDVVRHTPPFVIACVRVLSRHALLQRAVNDTRVRRNDALTDGWLSLCCSSTLSAASWARGA